MVKEGSFLVELLGKGGRLRRVPDKPIRFSMVRDGRGRYLWGDGASPIVVRGGLEYSFDIVYIDSPSFGASLGVDDVSRMLIELSGDYVVYGNYRVRIEPREVRVLSSDSLGGDLRGCLYVKVMFRTPTLLQYPKHPRLRIRESIHALYPQPLLIMLSLVRKWNRYEGVERMGISNAIFAPYELREVNHEIRPVTVHMGRVRTRGFVGWIIYRVVSRSDRRVENYLRLLDMGRYTGVGRSTTMGLGLMNLVPLRGMNQGDQ